MKLIYGPTLDVEMFTPEQAMEELDPSKAAGTPYNYDYGPLKRDSLRHLNFDDLLKHFCMYDNLHTATLKSEMRIKNKTARMFVPTNLCLIAVGNWLFGAQNNNIINNHEHLPIKVGMVVPGRETFNFWNHVLRWEGKSYDADGSRWDSTINMTLVLLARELRKCFIPKQYHKLVDKYYDQVYYGHTRVLSYILILIGQLSGQTNTTSDNSLIHSMIMILHAIRNKVSFNKFIESVEWYVQGDDLMYNTTIPEFEIERLEVTWNSLGMYIESRGQVKPSELSFVGMTPQKYKNTWLYKFRTNKMICSMNYHEKGSTHDQIFNSLVNLTRACFADHEEYLKMREATHKYLNQHKDEISAAQQRNYYLLDDYMLFNQFTNYE